jgi:hypothetical protein
MNDPVETLMKRSISVAREYRELGKQLTQLIDGASAQTGMTLCGKTLSVKYRR